MKSKKAQLGQVFIYIFAAVLAVSIMIYGYNTIRGFGQRTEQIALVRFKTDLESEIRQIASDYGSVKKVELGLPSKYTKVCFVDFEKPLGVIENSEICTAGENYNPLGCDAWKDKTQNIFLVPWTDFVIKTGNIKVDPEGDGVLCVPSVNNRIVLRLEGLGDRTLILKWEEPK